MTDKKEQAYQDYIKGMKYADIAEKYGVTESAVKQWAVREWKHKKVTKVTEITEGKVTKVTSEETKPPPRKKGGANNAKHNAYKKASWEVLENDEERELIENIDVTPETMQWNLIETNYKNLLLRERRLQKEVKHLKEESAGNKKLILSSVTKIRGAEEDKTITVAEAVFNSIKTHEAELTKIAAQKTKLAAEIKSLLVNKKNNTDISINGKYPAVQFILPDNGMNMEINDDENEH